MRSWKRSTSYRPPPNFPDPLFSSHAMTNCRRLVHYTNSIGNEMAIPPRPVWLRRCPLHLGVAICLLGVFCVRSVFADGGQTDGRSLTSGQITKNKAARKTAPEQARYAHRKKHDPNGIGKFYMGREIARVMSFHGAPWLERPEREREEKLSLLIKSLKLKPGLVAVDIGAGSGVMTVLLADEVAPNGKVIAVDIQEEMLILLAKKLERLKIENVEVLQGTVKTPRLPASSVDLVLLADVYHEFEFPYEMMLAIAKALKPGGRVVFVEYRKEDPNVPIKLIHKMTAAQVKKEIGWREFGLKWKETIDVLPRQHIVVFERPSGQDDRSRKTRPRENGD